MTTRTHNPRIAGCALLVLGIVLFAPVSSAATTPIYKCFDKNHALLYTDEPCKDGQLLNIRAGDADAAAVARLDRERDALDRSAAQRIADERYAAAQQDFGASYSSQDLQSPYQDEDLPAYAPYDYGANGWFPGFAYPHLPRSRPPKPLTQRRFVVEPSHMMVPRR
jgi:hypothetical protein